MNFSWHSGNEEDLLPEQGKVSTLANEAVPLASVGTQLEEQQADLSVVVERTRSSEPSEITITSNRLSNHKAVSALDTTLLGPAVRVILGLEGNGNYRERNEAIKDLEVVLNEESLVALLGFIEELELASGLSVVQSQTLKNNIMSYFIFNEVEPRQVSEALMRVASDRRQDIVVRDYALQHLVDGYEMSPLKEGIDVILAESLAEKEGSIAGTAMLGMVTLIESGHNEVDSDFLIHLENATHRSESIAHRVTALQSLSRLEASSTLAIAEAMFEDSESPILLISAIAAMGEFGDSNHYEYISGVLDEGDRIYQKSAQNALLRFRARGIAPLSE